MAAASASIGLALATSAPAAPGDPVASEAARQQAKKKSPKGKRKLTLVESAGRLQEAAAKKWPGTFAGLWIERGKIFVAFTQEPRARLGTLRDRTAKPKKVKRAKPAGVVFDDSLVGLEAIIDQASADRQANALISAPYDLTVDIQRNVVVAITATVIPRTVQVFQARYGDKVVVEQGPVTTPFACTRASCGSSIRAGLESYPKATGGGCTAGFVVRHRGPVSNLILSAAHCGSQEVSGTLVADLGATRFTGAPRRLYGNVFLDEYGGPVDAEVHKVSSGFDARKPLMYVDESRPGVTIKETGKVEHTVEGMQVCKSGKTTGDTCGVVTDTDYRPNKSVLPPLDHMIKTRACAWYGDSGAPVYSTFKQRRSSKPGYTALGILQGGHPGTQAAETEYPCTNREVFKYGDAYMVFSHIDHIESALPVKVLRARDLKKK